jgi:1,4-dihydroxy-2-naphthoate octaprenyltransferase
MSLSAYAGVARAPFLLLPVTLVVAGTGASAYLGQADWFRAALALVGMLGVHTAVNALNEASDYRTGIDLNTQRTPFSGGSGTLPAGRLSHGKAVATGLLGAAVGLAVGIYFLTVVGWPLVPILLVGAVAILAYTDVLARSFVGEFFAGLGLGSLPILGTALVQSGGYEPVAVAASLPAFFMTFNLLLLNEFPDEQADREGGRRNLVVLLGRRGAARLYALFGACVPLSIVFAVLLGHLPALTLAAVVPSLLLVKPLQWALGSAEDAVPIPALGSNVIWNLSTNVVLGIMLAL